MTQFVITDEMIQQFLNKQKEEEKSKRVIAQYERDLNKLKEILKDHNGLVNTKTLNLWKETLNKEGYAKGTITNKTVHINHFLKYFGYETLCFKKGGKKDLTGRRFGNLTVIKETPKRSSDRSIYWQCRCELCGKLKEIPANQLIKGVQTSCGCEKSLRLQRSNGYIDGTCLKTVFSDKRNSNNTSGHKGVFKKREKWAAKIQYKKKNYYLGSYDRIEDAVSARKEGEELVRKDAKKLLKKLERIKETDNGTTGKIKEQ